MSLLSHRYLFIAEEKMKKRVFILIIAFLSAAAVLSFGSVSAQDTDLDSMTDEQLMTLLRAIMQKLEERQPSAETPEITEPDPAGTPLAGNDPEAALKGKAFRIYDNKKLIIEGLPSYMFVRPEENEEEPEKPVPGKKKKEDPGDPSSCPVGAQCVDDDWYCRWELSPDGECRCMCG